MTKRRYHQRRKVEKSPKEQVAMAVEQRAAQPKNKQEIEHKIEETKLKAEKVKLGFLFLRMAWSLIEIIRS